MPKYIVSLGTEDGRVFEKEFDSPDEVALRDTILRDGYYIFSIKKDISLLSSLTKSVGSKGLSSKELISFNQELLALTKAGLPIIKSLDAILERSDEKGIAVILKDVRESIKGGASLSDAFEKFPRAFPPLYVSSIRAGEKSGDLVFSLKRYIDYLKKMEIVRKKIISASVYPAVLVFVAAVVILFLLAYVVPTFSSIFLQTGSNLPYATLILIKMTTVLKSYFLVIVTAIIIIGVSLKIYSGTEKGRRLIDRVKLETPLIGTVINGYAISKFSRTLSTILSGGIPLVESLRMVSSVLNNKILEEKAHRVIKMVEEGTSFTDSIESVSLLPPMAIKMLGVGESSGALGEMLNDIANYYDDEVDSRLSTVTSLIEPALMLLMGAFIAFIVIAMYLPIFKMGEASIG